MCRQPIYWSADTDPTIIELAADPEAHPRFACPESALTPFRVAAADADHLRLSIAGERFDVHIRRHEADAPLSAVVRFGDDDTPDRLLALSRFWTALRGKRVPPDDRITPQRRHRARQMLRVIDARQAGATYRAIAEVLFPDYEIRPSQWAGHALRETIIRLARDGRALVNGGYRSLFHRPRRDR